MSCFLGDTDNARKAIKIQRELHDLNLTLEETTMDMDDLKEELNNLCLSPSERQWIRLQQEYR